MKYLTIRDHLSDKTRLGYNNSLKTKDIDKKDKKDEGNYRNYANTLRSGINNQKGVEEHDKNRRSKFRRGETPRRSFPTRYENIFLGHFYTCKNFGHKEIHYKSMKETTI
jgi:hypothetical protein